MDKFETISLLDFIEYCVTDSTMFFDFSYDEETKNFDFRITNEIGAYLSIDKFIEFPKLIHRDRTFRISKVKRFSMDKYPELVCDSILDVGQEKNEIWFSLGEGETLRVEINEGFEISTPSLASFKKEIASKS